MTSNQHTDNTYHQHNIMTTTNDKHIQGSITHDSHMPKLYIRGMGSWNFVKALKEYNEAC